MTNKWDWDSQEAKKEISKRNHDAIRRLFEVLNLVKGFEVSYSNPSSGTMLLSIDGKACLMDISQLLNADDMLFSEQVKDYQYLLK